MRVLTHQGLAKIMRSQGHLNLVIAAIILSCILFVLLTNGLMWWGALCHVIPEVHCVSLPVHAYQCGSLVGTMAYMNT